MKKYSYTKEERLCSKKQIDLLFSKGSSFVLYPFRILWIQNPEPALYPAQVVLSVPKKRFKRAVDRNRIKRRIRESYRILKTDKLYPFLREHNINLYLMIIYTGNEIITTKEIEKKLNLAFDRLLKEHVKTT